MHITYRTILYAVFLAEKMYVWKSCAIPYFYVQLISQKVNLQVQVKTER